MCKNVKHTKIEEGLTTLGINESTTSSGRQRGVFEDSNIEQIFVLRLLARRSDIISGRYRETRLPLLHRI